MVEQEGAKMKEKLVKVKCFVCDKEIDRADEKDYDQEGPTDVILPTYGALVCRTSGNFGSTLYDPLVYRHEIGYEFIEFYVCDECFKKKAKEARWVKYNNISVPLASSSFEDRLKEIEQIRQERKKKNNDK
jgi:hypothetical protein